MCACVCACVCVCVCVCVIAGKQTGMYPEDDVQACLVDGIIDEEIDLFMGLAVSRYTGECCSHSSHIQTYIHTNMHAYIHTSIHTYIHTYTHVHFIPIVV